MIDYNKEIVAALNVILPTYYEMVLTSDSETPCISYMERSNVDTDCGDTFGYSRISYTFKVWGTDIGELQRYAQLIDKSLRSIGFNRISSNELYDNNSAMIQKILAYEALAQEVY